MLFRPPYGEDALRCSRIAEARMLPTTVLWSVDPSDWLERDTGAIAAVILDGLAPGAIIDLHDCWPRRHVDRGRPHADGGGAAHRAARDGRLRVPVR